MFAAIKGIYEYWWRGYSGEQVKSIYIFESLMDGNFSLHKMKEKLIVFTGSRMLMKASTLTYLAKQR